MKFSERHGYKSVRDAIQFESMDEALRNGLWNILDALIWRETVSSHYVAATFLSDNKQHQALVFRIWASLFKKPIDRLSNDWAQVLPRIREHFFEADWYEVYDFVEFVANNYDSTGFEKEFADGCNHVLEQEKAAYRLVDGNVVPITDKEELQAISDALERKEDPVRIHLRRALELLSERQSPDYRNSIKESILAVESLVMKVTGSKGTLGQLIKKLEDEIDLHPALRTAFSSLYGFTSDEGGIRHALSDASTIDFVDAKLMLVLCSGFINFVESKLAKGE